MVTGGSWPRAARHAGTRRARQRTGSPPARSGDGRPCPPPRPAAGQQSARREPQPQHLAPAQPGQQHRQHHRPVPVRMQRADQLVRLLRRQDPRQRPRHPHQRRGPRPHRPALPPGREAARHRVGPHRRIAPRDQVRIQARHRRQAAGDRRADSPDSRSASRITLRSPRGSARKSNTSAAVTSTGSFPVTAKNVFRSKATPAAYSVGTGPPRTPDTGPPAHRRNANGPGQTPIRNAQDTGSCSFQHHPSL